MMQRSIGIFSVLLLAFAPARAAASEALLEVDEVVRKTVERARWAREQHFQRSYSFNRSTVVEELDSKGKVKSRQESSKHVPAKAPVDPNASAETGLHHDRSKSNGEGERMLREWQQQDNRQSGKKQKFEIDEDTVSRFRFEITGRESVNGRPALILRFQPRSNLPVRKLQDHLVNKATGRLWVDESEFEVVKADIRLLEPVQFLGGILGTVHQFTYTFERTRVDEGVWLLAGSETLIKARKLVQSVHTRKHQRWSDFRKATAPTAQAESSPGAM